MVFWDNVACVYDIFANIINRKANQTLCAEVEKLIRPTDDVLECACGTGLLTGVIAPRCKSLVATDFSAKMLERTEKSMENTAMPGLSRRIFSNSPIRMDSLMWSLRLM